MLYSIISHKHFSLIDWCCLLSSTSHKHMLLLLVTCHWCSRIMTATTARCPYLYSSVSILTLIPLSPAEVSVQALISKPIANPHRVLSFHPLLISRIAVLYIIDLSSWLQYHVAVYACSWSISCTVQGVCSLLVSLLYSIRSSPLFCQILHPLCNLQVNIYT
jgi:hypothetical protein